MQKPFRRFELLLPTKFNNGLPVPNDAFADTLLELEERLVRFHQKARQSQVNGGMKGMFTGMNPSGVHRGF